MVNLDASQNNVFFRCVEDSTEAIMISNRDGYLTYVNPAWVKIYGYTSEEAIGETPRLLRSRHQTSEFYKEMWGEILNPEIGSWRGELINKAKDGREVPVELSITPIKHEGETVGYMALALDMTEKKQMMAQIFQQDRMASVGLLASGLAHEIGTPLGVIRGRAELLMNKAKDDDYMLSGLEIIIQQIDRVSKLIKNLLNLGRGLQGGSGTCNALDVVTDSVSLLRQKFQSIGVEIIVDVPDSIEASISHNQLEQVIINLMVNASHAIRGAIVNGRNEGHQIKIYAEPSDQKLLLFVQDTGTGVSKEAKENLFRPFYSTKPVGQGTGLGLSLSNQIISEIGGRLSLYETQLGEGTTFKIELPLRSS